MRPFLPNWIFGALLGFIVGILGWTGLPAFGLDCPRRILHVRPGRSRRGKLYRQLERSDDAMERRNGGCGRSHRFCARLRRSASTRTGFAPGSALGNLCDRPVRRRPRGVAWAGHWRCPAPDFLEARAAVARVETGGAPKAAGQRRARVALPPGIQPLSRNRSKSVLDRPRVLVVFARHSPFRLLFVGALARDRGMRDLLGEWILHPLFRLDRLRGQRWIADRGLSGFFRLTGHITGAFPVRKRMHCGPAAASEKQSAPGCETFVTPVRLCPSPRQRSPR